MNVQRNLTFALLAAVELLCFGIPTDAAEKYTGRCDVVFEGDSTLHRFTGDITNVPLTVICETNRSGEALLSARVEMAPRQLTTHHAKRDANMYKMFQPDRFPKLIALVTNAPLAAARLSPSDALSLPGTLPVHLTICGISKAASATTLHPMRLAEGLEFELEMDLSLKDFNLQPPSALLGAVSVRDRVKVRAHIKLQKEPP
jgi:hypothetical protein